MGYETGLGQASSWGARWHSAQRVLTARRGAFVLALIVLASLAFRLHVSTECSLWLDEVTTRLGVLKPWPQVLAGPSREHPPLMYIVLRTIFDLFGDTETNLRSLSLFFGCVLLLATYELCLELGLTVGRTLILVAALALCPFFIRHGTEARHYAILAALITLALTRVLRILRGPPRSRDFVSFAVSALAAAWTQYFGIAYALALLGALVLGLAPVWRQSSPARRVVLVASLSGLLAGLWFAGVRATAVGMRFESGAAGAAPAVKFNAELFREIPAEFSQLTSETWSWLIEPGLALAGLALLTWRLRGVARLLPFGIGLVPCVAALFIPASVHFVSARYLVPSGILYHVAAGVAVFAAVDGLGRVLSRRARSESLAPAIGWLLLASVLAVRLREFPTGFNAGGDDYRALQRYFVANLAKDTRLVAYIGFFGELLMGKQYRVGSKPIWLEKFRPVRGIDRYLVVEIHVADAERRAAFESLIQRKLGLTPEAWRALPIVPLPHSRYQPAVTSRLVQLRK